MSRLGAKVGRRGFLEGTALSIGGSVAGGALFAADQSTTPAAEGQGEAVAKKRLSFPPAEYRIRLKKVQELMASRGLDALLVSNMASICYLTGLESIAVHKYWVALIPGSGDPVLLVQDFESYNAWLYSWVEEVESYPIGGDPVAATRQLLQARRLEDKRVGVEIGWLSSLSPQNYLKLRDALPTASLVDASDLVPWVARIKSPAEIACLRRAARISSDAMRAAIDALAEGRTDNELAAVACERLFRQGSEYMCYQPIITVGANSGIPHSTFHRTAIRRGDPVFMEFGACVNRYTSPIMRTAVIGKPADKMKRMFGMCLAGVNTSLENMKPGITGGQAAEEADAAMGRLPAGWVWHGCYAYSIGLGFPPEWDYCLDVGVWKGNQRVLQPGMAFHCSTSIRDPGKMGTTCSETVLITDSGCEVLTNLPRILSVK